jgi:hypothetical protein
MSPADGWNDTLLDTMRTQGDPPADAVIREIFARGQVAAVNQLMQQLFRNDTPLPDALPDAARTFFEQTAALPTWADHEQIARGAALFGWLTGEAQARLPLLTHMTEQFGCAMVEGLMRMERGGRRPTYSIPLRLPQPGEAAWGGRNPTAVATGKNAAASGL